VIHEDRILEGAPEDLGISGLFGKLFQSSGVRYDQLSGRFKYDRVSRGNIRLEGKEGAKLHWTRSALERLGYQLDSAASSSISLRKEGPAPLWVLSIEDETYEFRDVYSLARFLNQKD
jgi:iron complex transport system ATP-binding protein